jgi:hypothetical protein
MTGKILVWWKKSGYGTGKTAGKKFRHGGKFSSEGEKMSSGALNL